METLVIESKPVHGPQTVSNVAAVKETPSSSLEHRLRLIVETAPVGLTVLSRTGQVHAANQAALTILGIQRLEEIRGRDLALFVSADYRQQFSDFVARVCDGGTGSLEYAVPSGDGGLRLVATRAVCLRRDDGTSAFLGATWDLPAPGKPAEAGDVKAQCEALEESLRELTDGYDALAREKTAIEASLADARARLDGATAVEGRHSQQASEWSAERSALQAQLREAEDTRRELAQRLDQHAQQAAQWDAERQGLQAQLRDANQAQRELAERADQQSQLTAEWDAERGSLQAQLRAAEDRQRELSERLERQSQLSSQWDAERGALEAHLREANDRQRDLSERLEHESRQAAHWNAERGALHAQLRDADDKSRELSDRLGRVEAERDATMSELAQQVETTHQITSELDALRVQYEKLLANLRSERERAETLVDERDRRTIELTTMLETLLSTTNRLSAMVAAGRVTEAAAAVSDRAAAPAPGDPITDGPCEPAVEPWAF